MTESSDPDKFYYVALGDSLANGVGADGNGYPQQLLPLLQKHQATELHLFATSGQTSTQLLRKQSLYLDHLKQANLITVNIGGNDLRLTWRLYGRQITPKSLQKKRMQLAVATLANNWNELAKVIAKSASPKTKVIFINLYNPYQKKYPQTRVFVGEANQLLKTICANYGFEVIDARSILNAASKKEPNGRELLLSKDNLHLSHQGHTILTQAIYKTIHPDTIWTKIKNLFKR